MKCKSCRKCVEVCPQSTITELNFPPRKPKAEDAPAKPAVAKPAVAKEAPATESPAAPATEAPKATE